MRKLDTKVLRTLQKLGLTPHVRSIMGAQRGYQGAGAVPGSHAVAGMYVLSKWAELVASSSVARFRAVDSADIAVAMPIG